MKEKLIKVIPFFLIGAILITVGIILLQKGVFGTKKERR